MRTLLGPLIYPDGTPMASATLILRSQRVNFSTDGLVANSLEQSFVTDSSGTFVQEVAFGDYQVWYQMPNTTALEKLGHIVVEAGAPIELGELIELSRDTTADYSISADWATKSWVIAQITLGSVPYDINVTALNPGAGTAGQLYKVTASGLNIEPFDLVINDFPLGTTVPKGTLYQLPSNKVGVRPLPRVVSVDTVAVIGDELTIDMNAATGDIDITLPAVWAADDPKLPLYVVSDDYILPYTINVLRNGAQTIMGIADDLQITRRRSMVLYSAGGNNVRFN